MSHYRCQAKTNNGKRCKKKKIVGVIVIFIKIVLVLNKNKQYKLL